MGETKQEKKHIQIDNVLVELENAVSSLADFSSELSGEVLKNEALEETKSQIFLKDVLDTTPQRIEKIINRLNGIRSVLRETLF